MFKLNNKTYQADKETLSMLADLMKQATEKNNEGIAHIVFGLIDLGVMAGKIQEV